MPRADHAETEKDMLVDIAVKREWKTTPYHGVTVSVLAENDAGGAQALLRLKAHAELPRHRHTGKENIYLLSGSIMVNDIRLHEGDFVSLAGEEIHKVIAMETSIYMSVSEKSGTELIDTDSSYA